MEQTIIEQEITTFHCPACDGVLVTEGITPHCFCDIGDLPTEKPHLHDYDGYCVACKRMWNIAAVKTRWADGSVSEADPAAWSPSKANFAPYLSYAELRRRGWTRDQILATPHDLTAELFDDGPDDEPGKIEHFWLRASIEKHEQQPGLTPTSG
jgi:hypothetical protein